jgi:hypothetical protein
MIATSVLEWAPAALPRQLGAVEVLALVKVSSFSMKRFVQSMCRLC